MKWHSLFRFLVLVLLPSAALCDATAMPLDKIGVGPSGYDFMIGRWHCTVASDTGDDPEHAYIYAHRSDIDNSLELDWQSYESRTVEHLHFDAKAKTWLGSMIEEDVNRGEELGSGLVVTSDVGAKSVWTGVFDYGDKYFERVHVRRTPMRWTWNFSSSSQFSNLDEEQTNGDWNLVVVQACAKM